MSNKEMKDRPIRKYIIGILEKEGVEESKYDDMIKTIQELAQDLFLKDVGHGAKSSIKFSKETVIYLLTYTPWDPGIEDHLAEYKGEKNDITVAEAYINEAIEQYRLSIL